MRMTIMGFMPVFLALVFGLLVNVIDRVDGFASVGITPHQPSVIGAQLVTASSTTQLFAADDDVDEDEKAKKDAALQAAIDAMYGDKPLSGEGPDVTKQRIEKLVQGNKVVLFMKGTKFFPQCGFSDTATKILEALNVEYEAVDVLSDESIRQGIKEYSQWPTIPQLYIKEEFIGGSDIMINMFENGELQEILNEES